MKNLLLLTSALFYFSFLTAQCDFPRNTGTTQYQNGISYSGKVHQMNLPDGRMVFSVDPSLLSLNKHEITGDSILRSEYGEWFFKWNFAGRPNRWQPMMFDCDASAVSIQPINGKTLEQGEIEVDFFYLDLENKISATFRGSIIYEITKGDFSGAKNSLRLTSID